MFLEYYGLREQPFGVTPDPRFIYFGPSHREALASLLYAIETKRGFSAMVAEPGMGKTSLLFHLLESLQNSARTAFLFQTNGDAKEILRGLLSDLGIKSRGKGVAAMHDELNKVLLEETQAGRKIVVVIDEAQNLDNSALESVRLLSNFETCTEKLMHIVLAGQPKLAEKLAATDLVQLRQRVSTIIRLEPFQSEETGAYITHRLAAAGYAGPAIFTPEAIDMIARLSEGIPRNINSICFQALSIGFATENKIVGAEIVREVSADLDFASGAKPETNPSTDPSPQPRPVEAPVANVRASVAPAVVAPAVEPPQAAAPARPAYPPAPPQPVPAPSRFRSEPLPTGTYAVATAPVTNSAPEPAFRPFAAQANSFHSAPVERPPLLLWNREPVVQPRPARVSKWPWVLLCVAVLVAAIVVLSDPNLGFSNTPPGRLSAQIVNAVLSSGDSNSDFLPDLPRSLKPPSAPAIELSHNEQFSTDADPAADASSASASVPSNSSPSATPAAPPPAAKPEVQASQRQAANATSSQSTSAQADGGDATNSGEVIHYEGPSRIQIQRRENLFQFALETFGHSNRAIVDKLCELNPQLHGPYDMLAAGEWIRLPSELPATTEDSGLHSVANREQR
jgi:type II secretory pathway predicted ATPase ExeA